MKRLVLLAICCVGLFNLSCERKQAATTIAVIPKGTTHEFWKSIHAGAEKAARESGATIIWKGPLKLEQGVPFWFPLPKSIARPPLHRYPQSIRRNDRLRHRSG
jgi:hypothetical protein